MAHKTEAGTAGHAAALPEVAAPAAEQAAAPMFEPFAWSPDVNGCRPLPAGAVLQFTETVRDMTSGAALVLSIIEADELSAKNEERTLFSEQDRSQMMRFAISALRTVASAAEHLEGWASTHRTKPAGGTR